jgi:hypothetical protein
MQAWVLEQRREQQRAAAEAHLRLSDPATTRRIAATPPNILHRCIIVVDLSAGGGWGLEHAAQEAQGRCSSSSRHKRRVCSQQTQAKCLSSTQRHKLRARTCGKRHKGHARPAPRTLCNSKYHKCTNKHTHKNTHKLQNTHTHTHNRSHTASSTRRT